MLKTDSDYFFATREDWFPALSNLEQDLELWFFEAGNHDSPDIPKLSSLSRWGSLGISRYGNQVLETAFTVAPQWVRIKTGEIAQRKHGVRYYLDLSDTPCAISFRPSGCFEDYCLIAGSMAPGFDNEESMQLYSQFRTRLFSEFTELKSYKVGPAALRLLKKGWRLTYSTSASTEYDLKL